LIEIGTRGGLGGGGVFEEVEMEDPPCTLARVSYS